MDFLIIFIILSIINVVFSTVRSIVTINGNKWSASLLSGGYFAFYNIMMLYTVADYPMWAKCLITFICNVIGVWFVKWVEERNRKERLWKVELAIPYDGATTAREKLKEYNIPRNFVYVGSWCMFNCYCMTQKDTSNSIQIAKTLGGKYSAYESEITP